MSYDINSQQVDIENLFKQNVNDLASIKELYRRLDKTEEKIRQNSYNNNVLYDKLKKEIETLYYSGMPVYEIAFRLGIPEFYIRKVLKKND